MKGKIVEQNTTRFLKYEFTEEEGRDLSNEMARKVTEAEDLEDQKKAVVSEFSSKINLARAEANSKAKKITSGFEMRQIDCKEIFNYTKSEVTVTRLDTDDTVEKRSMTNYELQEKIFPEEEVQEDKQN